MPRLEALEERQLLTTLVALTNNNTLFTFDSSLPAAATSMTITGLLPDESLLDIAVRPATGQLYGLSFSHLYKIDPSSGAASLVGDPKASLGLLGTQLAMSFDPVLDQLRVVTAQVVNKVTQSEQNLALAPDTAQVVTTGTAPQYAAGDLQFGRTPRLSHLAYTDQFAGATTTTLYGIDDEPQVPDYLVTVGGSAGVPSPDQGSVFTVGSTGTWSCFTVGGPSNTAFALSADDNSLWTVNLANGTGTLVRSTGLVGQMTALAALIPLQSLPALSIDDVVVSECSSMTVDAVFTLSLSMPSSQAVTVQMQTRDGSAFSPQDYQPLALTTLTFSPQQTTQAVIVKVNDNQLQGGVETFFVDLSNPNGAIITKEQGRGTINNHPPVLPPPNQSLVEDFYLDLLGRLPDAAGQTYWQGLLDAGSARGLVVQSFLNSAEHATNQVEDLYTRFLGRNADAAGLQNFLAALAEGVPPDRVESIILGSPEYMAGHAGTMGFLQGVYSDVLERQIDPGGAAFWSKALAGGEPPAAVADQIIQSVEAVQKLVNAHYRRFLKRDADPVAQKAWVTQIQASSSNRYALDLTLASSLEFYDQIPPKLYQDFVTKLYHDLLGRAPDPGGFTHWTDQLDRGTVREQVVLGFVTSDEYRRRFITQGGIPANTAGLDPSDPRFANALQVFSNTGLPGGGTLIDERVHLLNQEDFGSGAGTQTSNFLIALFSAFYGVQVDPQNPQNSQPPVDQLLRDAESELQQGTGFQEVTYAALNVPGVDSGAHLALLYLTQFVPQTPDVTEVVNNFFPGRTGSLFGVVLQDFEGGVGAGVDTVLATPEEFFVSALLGTNEYFPRG